MKLLNKIKNKNSEKENTENTVSDLINIEDIRGELLYTKDGYVFSYIKVQPISIDLKTKEEKKILTDKLTAEISSLKVPFKMIFLSKKADIKNLVSYYEEIKSNTVDPIKRDNLTKTIRNLSKMSIDGGVLERQSYICLWDKKENKKEHISMTYSFKNSLNKCEYTSVVCNEYEIRSLCNLFLNPNIHDTEVRDIYNGIPFLS